MKIIIANLHSKALPSGKFGISIFIFLILAVPWVCLQFVFVVFPDHTHYY